MHKPVATHTTTSRARRAALIVAAALSLTAATVAAERAQSIGSTATGDTTTIVDKAPLSGGGTGLGGVVQPNGRSWS